MSAAEKEFAPEKPVADATVVLAENRGVGYKLVAVVAMVVAVSSIGSYVLLRTSNSPAQQMTAEQVMKMVPQSAYSFQYGDLHTMRETPGLQEWYADIESDYLSSGSFASDSVDYVLWTSGIGVLGGRFDYENVMKLFENYQVENYKGYQIYSWYSSTAIIDDKIVSGFASDVKTFIDVLKGDNDSMYENTAYDEVKTEITGGTLFSIGRSLLSPHDEEILGYSINQTENGLCKVKTVYSYENQEFATETLGGLENYVRTYWTGGSNATIEQKGKMIVIEITLYTQSARDLLGWVVGSTSLAMRID